MDFAKKTEIQLSKSKITLMLMGSLAFVGIGVWFVSNPPEIDNPFLGSPTKIFIVGLASIIVFGVFAFFAFKKLWDKSPGLVISEEGVFDNTSAAGAGLVPWTDILEIKETKIVNQTFINLIVKNPQDYIDRQKNSFKRKLMQMNYDTYGTVIGISSSGLKCNYRELKEMLDKAFSDSKRKTI
jgi:hypothetical protein